MSVLIASHMLRGSVDGVLAEYTVNGWMIDWSERCVRARIVDLAYMEGRESEIGKTLKALRRDTTVQLKLWLGDRVEYEGSAVVKMVRFRAQRNVAANFSVQFKMMEKMNPAMGEGFIECS